MHIPSISIVVGSTSKLKINAVRKAAAECGIPARIAGVQAASGVNKQPFNKATKRGAKNRAKNAQEIKPDADLYIGIENGLFDEGGNYFDKAVIYAIDKSGERHIVYSDAVKFPKRAVKKARKEGFDKITVGEILYRKGKVKNAADPHKDLGKKKSRVVILQRAIVDLLRPLAPIYNMQLAQLAS
jgi:non-canonical (house-cleaning) NTP pyrophosphatase